MTKRDSRSEPLILGIDLGGTKILTAVASATGKLLASEQVITPAEQGPETVIEAIVAAADRTLGQAGIAAAQLSAVGVGAAGISNPDTGVIFSSPNLPGWQDVPLRDIIERRLGIKTYLGNDANAAALGELYFGAGRGARHLIYVTVSTGIGGGIIIDGKLYTGTGGTAGEVGHMTIADNGPLCTCGNTGCWEVLASGTALAKEAQRRLKEGAKTSILEQAGGDIKQITAQVIHAAAQEGDVLAGELIAQTGYYVGVGLVNLVNIFNPELIIIGGGLSRMGDRLLKPAIKVVAERAFKPAYQAVRFTTAQLEGNSGVLGAVALALQEMKSGR